MDLHSAFGDINLNKQGAYLRLSRIAENQALEKDSRYEACILLLDKAVNEENLE